MPRKSADVTATTTIDLAGLAGRLLDAERKVLVRNERKVLGFIRDRWVGWLYKGRAKGAPRNVSFRAWKSTLQTTDTPYELQVANEARSYDSGKPYVAHVHRAGETRPEHLKLADAIEADLVPGMGAEFNEEIKKALEPRPRKKLRSRGTTQRVTRTLEG